MLRDLPSLHAVKAANIRHISANIECVTWASAPGSSMCMRFHASWASLNLKCTSVIGIQHARGMHRSSAINAQVLRSSPSPTQHALSSIWTLCEDERAEQKQINECLGCTTVDYLRMKYIVTWNVRPCRQTDNEPMTCQSFELAWRLALRAEIMSGVFHDVLMHLPAFVLSRKASCTS